MCPPMKPAPPITSVSMWPSSLVLTWSRSRPRDPSDCREMGLLRHPAGGSGQALVEGRDDFANLLACHLRVDWQ